MADRLNVHFTVATILSSKSSDDFIGVKWINKHRKKSHSVLTTLHFSVERIYRLLHLWNYSERAGAVIPVYHAAAMKYLATEFLEQVGNTDLDYKKIMNFSKILLTCCLKR